MPRITSALCLFLLTALFACAEPSGPDRVRSRIAFDVSGITGAAAALGNGASVVARADIVVTPANDSENVLIFRQLPLTSTDSVATFDIELEQGSYTVWGYVFSNSDALLYEGHVDADIDDDDFVITIVPTATNAVMIVSPRTSIQPSTLEVRNVGSLTLVWRTSCIRIPPTSTTCLDPRLFGLPSQDVTLPPGATATLQISVPTGVPTGDSQVEFTSNVGDVTIAVSW